MASSSQISPRFVIFVVVSLLTHLMDVAGSGLFCHMLMQQGSLKTPWFSISAGLLIIPLVGLQLISAVYLLRRKGESSSTMDVTLTAVLHVLQLGFISRHFAILQESSIPSRKYEISEMLVLRLVFSLTSGLPLLLIKLHVLFQDIHEPSWDWSLYLTCITALVAVTWALATFRRHLSGATIDALLVTCPGTILKILWRAGEVATRVIALSLFASLYSYWLFLVVGLHWFAMFVCVCVPAITPIDVRTDSILYRFMYSIVASFTYVFVFINTTCENTVFRYTFYYIIFFLENTTLITVWSVQASSEDHDKHGAFIYVAAASFLISVISMIIYYKFFHIATPKEPPTTQCTSPDCGSCKLNLEATHPPIPPRPADATGHWLSQYHTAIYCGQHCKHNGHDSLLDSTSERNSILTVSSSHARLQQKLATINDDRNEHSSSCKTTARGNSSSHVDSSVSEHQNPSSPSKSRKKNKNKKKGESAKKSDSERTSVKTAENNSEGSESQRQPVWLPSGDSNFANQLLTYSLETFDTNAADDERSSVATGGHDVHFRPEISPRDISSVHKQMESGTWTKDRHWYSDGYSTDRTLDWANRYPAALLHKNRFNSSFDTTDEDTFHCQECSHGDSEVSSIMRTIDDVPEAYPSGRRSREISPRDRKHNPNHHHHNHHHHQHPHHDHHRNTHGHHRQGRNNVDSKSKSSDVHRDFPTNTDKSHKIGSKSHASSNHRAQMLPSPASDPSHGPKPKRRGSPKRRVHGSVHPDPSPSQIKTTDQSLKLNIHQSAPPTLPSIDNRMAQSEQIAKELLSNSSVAKKARKQNRSTLATPDPRFNVRVMLSQSADGQGDQQHPVQDEPDRSMLDERLDGNVPEDFNTKTGKKKIFGVTERETDVDRCIPVIDNGKDSDGVKNSQEHNSGEKDRSSYKNSNSLETSSNDKKRVSISTEGKDEVIYENIWQVKPDDGSQTRPKTGIKSHTVIPTHPHVKAHYPPKSPAVRDAWYMCSESEDSALPPEALSSSVDGFTASENGSDASVEIVI